EAVQARLGSARLRLRRPPHAVREVLRRPWLRDEQLQLSHRVMAGLDGRRRRVDGELRRAGWSLMARVVILRRWAIRGVYAPSSTGLWRRSCAACPPFRTVQVMVGTAPLVHSAISEVTAGAFAHPTSCPLRFRVLPRQLRREHFLLAAVGALEAGLAAPGALEVVAHIDAQLSEPFGLELDH